MFRRLLEFKKKLSQINIVQPALSLKAYSPGKILSIGSDEVDSVRYSECEKNQYIRVAGVADSINLAPAWETRLSRAGCEAPGKRFYDRVLAMQRKTQKKANLTPNYYRCFDSVTKFCVKANDLSTVKISFIFIIRYCYKSGLKGVC